MGTHTIPDKVKAKIDRIFGVPACDSEAEAMQKANKDRTIKNLEAGKTVHIVGVKLRGVKVEKDERPIAPPPPAPGKTSDSAKAAKDK